MNYFKTQIELLQKEEAVDKASFLDLTQSVSLSQRQKEGLTWYPIIIRNEELGYGDYLKVTIERTTEKDQPHQFRFGSLVRLYSRPNKEEDYIDGIVSYQSNEQIRITLKTDELPDWTRNGKLGVDLLFDDNSYKEMFSALSNASAQVGQGGLIDILTGTSTPTWYDEVVEIHEKGLNEIQKIAVQKIIQAKDLMIVHGPPGTGKTTTLVAAAKILVKDYNQKLLVTAPSNNAVDLLCKKMAAAGLKVLRIGNPARVSDQLMDFTLDAAIEQHPDFKRIKELKKQAAEYKKMAHQYKRHFGKSERDQRKALFSEAKDVMKLAQATEQYIVESTIAQAEIIAATLVGCNNPNIRELKFDTVIVDEAAQALEPAVWIPALKTSKIIFAGDHQQLPPTVKSPDNHQEGLSKTLFEKCVQYFPEAVVMLEEQYRMHPKIMEFSSRYFYEDRLKAVEGIGNQSLFPTDSPFEFLDTAGAGFEEKAAGLSFNNPEEAHFTVQYLENYLRELCSRIKEKPSVAVISPYKQQVSLLTELVAHNPFLHNYAGQIQVNTIDGFQGQERPIVFISLVRSNDKGIIGFLSDLRRMNVAMTRAQKKLVIAGDSATLSSSDFYEKLINYSQTIEGYHSVWEYQF